MDPSSSKGFSFPSGGDNRSVPTPAFSRSSLSVVAPPAGPPEASTLSLHPRLPVSCSPGHPTFQVSAPSLGSTIVSSAIRMTPRPSPPHTFSNPNPPPPLLSSLTGDSPPPLKRQKIEHGIDTAIKEEFIEDALFYPVPFNSFSVVIKTENRTPSPTPPSRQLVTTSCNRYPLPENCSKTNADYFQHRQALVKKESAVLKKFSLKITKVFFRCVPHHGHLQKMNLTLCPDEPETTVWLSSGRALFQFGRIHIFPNGKGRVPISTILTLNLMRSLKRLHNTSALEILNPSL